MDRSFLSRKEVIDASRQVVCVRLATYENADEAALMKRLVRTGSGELENTGFCILAPDARTKLIRPAREIGELFASPQDLAAALDKAAQKYQPKPEAGPAPLPEVTTVKLAVNVAAADSQPLVVLGPGEPASARATKATLAGLAWTPEFVGHFVYASAATTDDLRTISSATGADGVLVVQPEKFGRSGTILARCPAGADAATVADTLRSGLKRFKADEKSFSDHVREGHRKRVFWETPIPVTDPMEQRARERGRRSQ
jgi:hypothetical protein